MLLREFAPDVMERSQSEKFVEHALKIMEEEASNNRYVNKFFQAVRMFLYVLRFRIKVPSFLSHELPADKQQFDRIINCLKEAQRHKERAKERIKEIEKYMKYEGTSIINLDEFCSDDEQE